MNKSSPWNLPGNWQWSTVGEIGEVVSGGTPSTKNPSFWDGAINWISPADLSGYNSKYIAKGSKSITEEGLENSSAKLMPAWSVHFSSRAPVGYVVISSESISTNQGFKSIVLADGIYNEYIYYYFKSAKQLAEERASGTTFKELSGKAFSNLPVPVAPENEQHRIVAKIEELFSELDKGVESLTTSREQLKVYRQALLKHAFEGKLTEQWRAEHADQLESADQLLARIKKEREKRYQEQLAEWEKAVEESGSKTKKGKKPAKPKKPIAIQAISKEELATLPSLPLGWGWFKVEELCEVVRGGSPRPAGDPKYYGGSIPFLKVADITGDEKTYLDSWIFTINEAGLPKTRLVKPNTLLISNSGATLGVPKICTIEATFNDGIAAFLGLDKSVLLYHYYYWLSKTRELRAINQGAAQPNLNTNLLKEYFIPICSTKEMMMVAEELERNFSAIGQQEIVLGSEIAKAQALRQSILKKAFSGELVPQDPNDEPASELLARIKAEREDAQQQAKKIPRKAKKKKEVITMADLMEVMKAAKDWMSAQEAFRKCGIADGAETDAIEKIYEELRGYVNENKIAVERRGEEDWLRLAQGV